MLFTSISFLYYFLPVLILIYFLTPKKYKNIILLIIAIVMFILVGSTMAYFGWSSSAENKDQLVDVTVAGGTGSCDKLSDNNKLLYPTSTREKGRILKSN